jgi:hypothetical protein
LKHRQYRPSLIVADDVEDLDWVRTQENRDKSARWMRGNVLPSIEERDGRMVIIGNWLHTDGLMARLKNTGLFTVLEFSLLREGDGTEAERCTWKAKYPTQEAIDRKRDELFLPNLFAKYAVGSEETAFVSCHDPRVQAFCAVQPKFRELLSRFTNAFGDPLEPVVFIVRDDVIPKVSDNSGLHPRPTVLYQVSWMTTHGGGRHWTTTST